MYIIRTCGSWASYLWLLASSGASISIAVKFLYCRKGQQTMMRHCMWALLGVYRLWQYVSVLLLLFAMLQVFVVSVCREWYFWWLGNTTIVVFIIITHTHIRKSKRKYECTKFKLLDYNAQLSLCTDNKIVYLLDLIIAILKIWILHVLSRTKQSNNIMSVTFATRLSHSPNIVCRFWRVRHWTVSMKCPVVSFQ